MISVYDHAQLMSKDKLTAGNVDKQGSASIVLTESKKYRFLKLPFGRLERDD